MSVPIGSEGMLAEQRHAAATSSGGASSDAIYSAAFQIIQRLNLSGRALDFGSGAGVFARQLLDSKRFAAVDAVDLVAYPGRELTGIQWTTADLNSALPLADESYDLVAAIEVIEHLENPRFLAREWHRLLRPGGALLLSTPNNESWRSLISLVFRGHYVAFLDSCYPAHITPLLRKDLLRILTEAQFSRAEFSFSEHGTLPKLTSLTWQKISFGLLRGARFSDNMICVARKGK